MVYLGNIITTGSDAYMIGETGASGGVGGLHHLHSWRECIKDQKESLTSGRKWFFVRSIVHVRVD